MNAVQRIVQDAEVRIAEIYQQPIKLIIVPIKGSDVETELNFLTAMVSKALNISYEIMFTKTRKREIVQARHFVMFYSKLEYKIGPSAVANFFGLSSHADVIHGRNKIQDLLDAKDATTVINKNLIEEELREHYQIKAQSDIK
jgi:chromosomal replication initiation ATPase DnaA